MNLPADRRRLRSIVDITWIISENWLNYVEYHDRELTVEAVVAGYDEILEVLRPYLIADPQRVTSESYSTIERLTAQPLAPADYPQAVRARARRIRAFGLKRMGTRASRKRLNPGKQWGGHDHALETQLRTCGDDGLRCRERAGACGGLSEPGRAALEEVVVTATKRGETDVQKTAESIYAVGGADLTLKRETTFEAFAGSVPGLQFQQLGPGDSEYIIRGINGSGPSVVGAYLDEYVITASDQQDGGGKNAPIQLVDVERVEVLNGPQGTLYGSNSMAGNIRFITNKPDASKFDAYGEADFSSDRGRRRRLRHHGHGQRAAVGRQIRDPPRRLSRGSRRLDRSSSPRTHVGRKQCLRRAPRRTSTRRRSPAAA